MTPDGPETQPDETTRENPDITWGEDGAPRSGLFDDVYFNPEDGRAESDHVFLGGVGLHAALRERERVAIGELGFGLGLNFLASWAAWRGTPAPRARLDFTSFELAPPSAEEIRRVAEPWPDLAPYASALADAWPLPDGEWTEMEDGLRLRVFLGDARERAPALAAREPGAIEAWYLDGFAPAKNPEMWGQELLDAVGALAAPGCKAASFTAAGWVRRGLAAAGFTVRKAPGWGRKKERLLAEKPARA